MTRIDKLQEELNHQYNLLQTIASVYLTVHELDLVNNTYYEYNSTDEIREYLSNISDLKEAVNQLFSDISIPQDRDETVAFTDLSTLRERMKDKKVIVHEFRGKFNGWIRAKFIVSERDETGYPTKVIHTTEVIEREKRKEEELTRLSYNDEMTHLYNRRAYDRDLRDINLNLRETVIYMSLDLNGLKTINDTFGHLDGDKAIKGAAICIFNTFGEYGNCYRIGGDEFAVIIKCQNNYIDNLIAGFKEFISYYNKKRLFNINVSIGYASNTGDLIYNIEDLIALADKRMYEDKDNYYEKNPQLVRRIN